MRTALVWEAPDAVRRGDNMGPEGRMNHLVYTNPLRLFQAGMLVQTILGITVSTRQDALCFIRFLHTLVQRFLCCNLRFGFLA